jgi:hypothetical protein
MVVVVTGGEGERGYLGNDAVGAVGRAKVVEAVVGVEVYGTQE